MITGLSLQQTTARMGVYYNATMSALSHSLTRLASGKNFNEPTDGIADYMRVQRVQRDTRGFETISRQLQEGVNMARMAETVGMGIVDSLQEMERLALNYWDHQSDPDAQARFEQEFDGLKQNIETLIGGNYYFGVNLMQVGTVASIGVDPNDVSKTIEFELDAGDIVSMAGVNVDLGNEAASMAELDTQLSAAFSYLSEVSGFLHSTEAQLSVSESMIRNGRQFEESYNGVDDVQELNKVTALDIRQQASLSMIAQGNMHRMGVLKLIEF